MCNLYSRTLHLLRHDKRTLRQIAAGANVNLHWLRKLKQGRFENPGVCTIERLYTFLSKDETKTQQAKALLGLRSLRAGLTALCRKAAA